MSRETQPKKSSKDSQQAMHEADAHTAHSNTNDAVPGDDTAHAHSHTAHPKSNFDEHLPPQGNQPANIQPNRKQPPEEISRSGKQHR